MSRLLSILCLCVGLLNFSAVSANGDLVIPVINGSFETTVNFIPNPGNSSYLGGNPPTLPGWTFGSAFGSVFNSTGVITSGLTGSNAIFVGGNIRQNTGAFFQTGVTYTLQADFGRPAASPLNAGGVNFGFGTATNSTSLRPTLFSNFVDDAFLNANVGTMSTVTRIFTASAADNNAPIIISINDFFNSNSNAYRVDNVRLSSNAVAVPEPSSLALGGLALVGGWLRRRFARRQ